MAERNTHTFLSAVWGERHGYVFLPYKDLDRKWHETQGLLYDGSNNLKIEELKADLYFCPVTFNQPIRRKEYANSTNLLWADLDPVHPDKCKVKPSIAWESSPGRYQALWFLTSDVPATEAAELSKRIAYAEGGDRGGWDVTQVLRIPGTKNYKYEMAPPVQLLWADRNAYGIEEITGTYPAVASGIETPTTGWVDFSEAAIQAAIQSLPRGFRAKLTRDPTGADRSKELQLLARDLVRRGIEPAMVSHLLQRSTLNKFAGRPTEQQDLLRQVDSAVAAVERPKKEPTSSGSTSTPTSTSPEAPASIEVTTTAPAAPLNQMQVHSWTSFMQMPTSLKWLVDEAWVDRSVGFISGRSKSYKTWIMLDLALSIVSGVDFLGRYPVRRTGPVILIQEEDPSPVLQERLRLIGKSKGMLPAIEVARSDRLKINYPDYPLHIINLQGFSLGSEEKIAQVRRMIAEINPVAVILDPLIVMLAGTGADENKATEMSLILQSVKRWREEFGCSVIIVHHWNKGKQEEGDRFAQHMYGSFVFHAWLESAMHVLPVIEDGQERVDTVLVEREFKAAPSGRGLKLKFIIDSVDKYEYSVQFDEESVSPMAQQLIDLLTQAGPEGMTTPELVTITGHQRPKVVEQLGRLVRLHVIQVLEKGGGRGKSTKYGIVEKS